jgi:hypothetical protein
MQAALDSIVCHTPLNNLGFSRKGSALTFSVAFQALRTGLFEVGQHWTLGAVRAPSSYRGNVKGDARRLGRGEADSRSDLGLWSGKMT